MKKNTLAAPGFEPGLFLVIKFCQKNGTFMNSPRNFWQYELSAVSPDRANSKKEFTAADVAHNGA